MNFFYEKIPACFWPLNFPAKKPNRLRPCTKSGFSLLRGHDTFNHHFDMKMQRARTNNIARERAITEKTVTSFRSIKVGLIESRDFSKTLRGKRERSETRRWGRKTKFSTLIIIWILFWILLDLKKTEKRKWNYFLYFGNFDRLNMLVDVIAYK